MIELTALEDSPAPVLLLPHLSNSEIYFCNIIGVNSNGTLMVDKTCHYGVNLNGQFGRIVDTPKTETSIRLIPASQTCALKHETLYASNLTISKAIQNSADMLFGRIVDTPKTETSIRLIPLPKQLIPLMKEHKPWRSAKGGLTIILLSLILYSSMTVCFTQVIFRGGSSFLSYELNSDEGA